MGTAPFSDAELTFEIDADEYTCPAGKPEKKLAQDEEASDRDHEASLSPLLRQAAGLRSLSAEGAAHAEPGHKEDLAASLRKHARDRAREIATTDVYTDTSGRRKKIEMLFAHLKPILRLDRLRLRGPNGAKHEFLLAATAHNLRKPAKPVPAQPAPAQPRATVAFGLVISAVV